MKVLVIGSGGREHALMWKLAQSPDAILYTIGGSGGMRNHGEFVVPRVDPRNMSAVVRFVCQEKIDLTVVGSERYLAAGIADAFRQVGRRIFAPTKAAALLESSKAFAREVAAEEEILTPKSRAFPQRDYYGACSYALRELKQNGAVVVQADGLADGKGTFICRSQDEVYAELNALMKQKVLGVAGDVVLVSEYKPGHEYSAHALIGDDDIIPFPLTCDHKLLRASDQDNDRPNPNTGGMGAYGPAIVPATYQHLLDLEELQKSVFQPAINGLRKRNRRFLCGFLYPGLAMVRDPDGALRRYLYEFNCRSGDPETQIYMFLLENDILPLLNACAAGEKLGDMPQPIWYDGYAVCVALAGKDYPYQPDYGNVIEGIEDAEALDNVAVFHGGTICRNNQIVTDGGRILYVVARAKTLQDARDLAYHAVSRIHFAGMYYRQDIGLSTLSGS